MNLFWDARKQFNNGEGSEEDIKINKTISTHHHQSLSDLTIFLRLTFTVIIPLDIA